MPEVYAAGSHIIEWFWKLDSTRSAGMSLNPIGPLAIEAWARLTDTTITPFEASALLEMDTARLQGPEEAVEHEAPASQAITPAVFDALFG